MILLSSPVENEGHFDLWKNVFTKFFRSSNLQFIVLENEGKMLQNLMSVKADQPRALLKFREQELELSSRHHKVNQVFKNSGDSKIILNIAKKYAWSYIPFKYKVKFAEVVYRHVPIRKTFVKFKHQETNGLDKFVSLKSIYPEIDLVIFLYLDFFKNVPVEDWLTLDSSLQSKWIMCLFDPDNFPTENLKGLQSLKVIIVTSEYARHRVQRVIGNQRIEVVIAPDFVPKVASPEESYTPLITSQNPIILMVGTISERKNLDLFLRCASSEQGASFSWVIGGRIYRDACSEFALDFLDNKASAFSNIHMVNRYITDQELEDLIRSSSVLFTIYKHWEYASNIVSRAAIYNVPVLVGEGDHIREIVQENSLGLVITSADVSSVFAGIIDLLNNPEYVHASDKFKETLNEQNFIDFLRTVLKKIDR